MSQTWGHCIVACVSGSYLLVHSKALLYKCKGENHYLKFCDCFVTTRCFELSWKFKRGHLLSCEESWRHVCDIPEIARHSCNTDNTLCCTQLLPELFTSESSRPLWSIAKSLSLWSSWHNQTHKEVTSCKLTHTHTACCTHTHTCTHVHTLTHNLCSLSHLCIQQSSWPGQ